MFIASVILLKPVVLYKCEVGLAAPPRGPSLSPEKLMCHSVALMHRVCVGT